MREEIMPSKTIPTAERTDGVAGGRREPERTVAAGREGKPCTGSAASDPARLVKAAESQDFPYFDFFPYGYLY
jgi:hypothetical protein